MLGLSVHRSAIVGRVLPVLTALALLLSACAPQRGGQPESKPAAPAPGAPAAQPRPTMPTLKSLIDVDLPRRTGCGP